MQPVRKDLASKWSRLKTNHAEVATLVDAVDAVPVAPADVVPVVLVGAAQVARVDVALVVPVDVALVVPVDVALAATAEDVDRGAKKKIQVSLSAL